MKKIVSLKTNLEIKINYLLLDRDSILFLGKDLDIVPEGFFSLDTNYFVEGFKDKCVIVDWVSYDHPFKMWKFIFKDN